MHRLVKLRILSLIKPLSFEIMGTSRRLKNSSWRFVWENAAFYNLIPKEKSVQYLRDSLWGNWKNRAMKKLRAYNLRGGEIMGNKCNLTAVDWKVLKIMKEAKPELFELIPIPINIIRISTKNQCDRRVKQLRTQKLQLQVLEKEIYRKKLACIVLERMLRVKQSVMTLTLDEDK